MPSGRFGASYEDETQHQLAEMQRRRAAYEVESEAERDPETGERPGVAERVTDTVEHLAGGIASHLPHAKA